MSKFRRVVGKVMRHSDLFSQIVEEDLDTGGRAYFIEVVVEGEVHTRKGPFFDEDEATQKADEARMDVYDEIRASQGKPNVFKG